MATIGAQRIPLTWLPRPDGLPPLSPRARVALGCVLARLETGEITRPPRAEVIARRKGRVWQSRVKDGACDWYLLYRIKPDVLVMGELRPIAALRGMVSFRLWIPLYDYDLLPDPPPRRIGVRSPPRRRGGAAPAWLQGDFAEFLEMPADEVALVRTRLALADRLGALRRERRWTQTEAAEALGVNRCRISRMEEPGPSVSLDLLTASLLGLGVSSAEIGALVAGGAGPDRARGGDSRWDLSRE